MDGVSWTNDCVTNEYHKNCNIIPVDLKPQGRWASNVLTHSAMQQGIPHHSKGNIWKQSCRDTLRVNKEYKKSHFHLFSHVWLKTIALRCAIYAGATEDTSVLDVDTSDPSSTFFPKSCMMHTRNWEEREIKIILQRFKVFSLCSSFELC